MTDRQKKQLEEAIASKGRCKSGCMSFDCPLSGFCALITFVDNFHEYIYRAAVKKYLEEFGKEKLVEVLL